MILISQKSNFQHPIHIKVVKVANVSNMTIYTCLACIGNKCLTYSDFNCFATQDKSVCTKCREEKQ